MPHKKKGDPTATALSILKRKYEIVRELGRGGTALVYLGRERSSSAEVAIKLIRAKYVEDEETLARFAREARYVGELHHPNVVNLRSVVELGDLGLALVMDHVAGQTLKQTIQKNGPLSMTQAESVLRDVAAALGAAHAMGIVHRDVKPENIFIDKDGRALLADFGVARSMTSDTQLTMTGIAIGTPAYMAPEQIDGIAVDGRGDIYSLGLVGWEMLTGKRPWEGSSLYAVIYQQKNEELPDVREMRPGIPDHLASAIAGAIEKDRDARWQSADELVAALDGKAVQRLPHHRPVVIANNTRQFVRPFAPVGDAEPTPLSAPAHQTFAEIVASTVAVPEQRRRGRRVITIGAAIAAGLVLLGLGLRPSLARTSLMGRSMGEVDLATQAGSPTRAGTASRPAPASDSSNRIALADTPSAASVRAIGPALRVAQSSSEPSAVLLERSKSFVAAASEPPPEVADPPTESDNKSAERAVSRDSVPSDSPASRSQIVIPKAPTPPPPSTVAAPITRVSIATGGAHTCLVMANGRTFCWGGNSGGQLGNGGTARLPSPSPVATELRFAAVTSGLSHSCAITREGAAWCWGENDQGQLGDRSTTSRLKPVPVADNHSFQMLSAGASHTCGLDRAGKAWCWGSNARGQLGGDGNPNEDATPVAVAGDRRFVSLASGWAFACALDTGGHALCWGENTGGQLGDGSREDRRKPTPVRTDIPFATITAGSAHACGLTAVGDAYCWGRNGRGQLGDGTTTDQATPVRVKSAVRFVSISAGAVHTCGIAADGAAYCWGQNSYGQVGDGGTTDRVQPSAVVGEHAFASIRAFGSHTCGATASGEAFCWGYNLDGQLGDGTRVHRTRPVYVEPPSGQ